MNINKQAGQLAAREWPAIERILSPIRPFDPSRPPQPPWFWDWRISPGFPADWPPSKAVLLYYVSAAGRNPSLLMDGEYYTAPWGIVTRDIPRDRYEFSRTSAPIERKGTQGVRPLHPDESRIFDDARLDEDFARALSGGRPAQNLWRRIRDYYKLWASCHGVGNAIKELHPGFFAWLQGELRDSF